MSNIIQWEEATETIVMLNFYQHYRMAETYVVTKKEAEEMIEMGIAQTKEDFDAVIEDWLCEN